jgi:hypothetical protein
MEKELRYALNRKLGGGSNQFGAFFNPVDNVNAIRRFQENYKLMYIITEMR